MNNIAHNILLADDDADDCMFFQEALDELSLPAHLTMVTDGVELMEHLNTMSGSAPELLFMDLNMPRKTGFDCLSEIRANDKLKSLPIIILSTSLDVQVVNALYENGANYYIRKPGEFSTLKKVISEAIRLVLYDYAKAPDKEKFVIQV